MKPIVIIAELESGTPHPASFEAVSFARALARLEPGPLRIIAFGADVRNAALEIAAKTGVDVSALENEHAAGYTAGLWKEALATSIAPLDPRFVVVPHTARGYDFAPGLAVRLGAGCVTAVEALQMDDGAIGLTRSAFGGKALMHIVPPEGCTVLTVLPGAFPPEEAAPAAPGAVTILRNNARDARSRALGRTASEVETASLNEAEVIVAAGRGIGKKENLALIRALAALFPRSAVAGSRAVCDAGWLEYARQVGVTGKTVSPRLYIACGISGTAQHVAGMKNAQTIIAINTDPGAPIFNIAHYGVAEDLTRFIPLFIEACGKVYKV
ncbi:MAG: electron transfer flavoprotein subunit alpha/FixB family protein [Spirochaetes bacterium]|jgi:electron transfer flavoprotein alpha subunit|nr:electron transfer flavoprotein subunit alpha/FixB family protein [Spirochaetota bacterium]